MQLVGVRNIMKKCSLGAKILTFLGYFMLWRQVEEKTWTQPGHVAKTEIPDLPNTTRCHTDLEDVLVLGYKFSTLDLRSYLFPMFLLIYL